MPFQGQAAMLLTFDIVEEAIIEHDDWHTHEHLPERLSIPGFLRGTRWVATSGAPRYLVLYEVEHLETLASPAYLERLNKPSPWTQKMMPNYRGMTRGLCSVVSSHGHGMGHFGLLLRFKPVPGKEASLGSWLSHVVLPMLPAQRGLSSAHLLRSGLTPEMTAEQRIRGADAGVDGALLVTGYEQSAVAELAQAGFSAAELERQGAVEVVSASYEAVHSLTHVDMQMRA
ncbi:DUF4286 family protein [Hydrogenophaga sp.]|jgi:hypothetical protein|uniref:DUF4286 family protein n=1 Tax=Hydrogenophaga sp. TaxID=1904254 RepID=UPI0025C0D079|nr:DUF4286 family protein [Hydrogenophaga sp.]MDO9131932.1 hypothetical protein [Hydrogenophaga sp.]MDO9504639.1 hypothetical protein [Hydrogenophaga sp.]MDP2987661.1 hypothetical protein [Hydrogenophaga sp.]MDP3627573.1 hypothetical protein [Hydrogenophaga sp.]